MLKLRPKNMFFPMSTSVVVVSLLVIGLADGEESCTKGDPACAGDQQHDKYSKEANADKFEVDDFLKEVDKLPREEARLDRLRDAIKNYPEEPSLMLALTKQYMAMFDRLHPKMRGIGEIELVQPSIQIYMQMLGMPEAKMSNEKHAEIVDHCITSVLGSSNKTASVMVIKEALERMNKLIPMESYQFYFESLVEELFFGQQYSEAVEMVDKVKAMFPGAHRGLRLLAAVINRYNEKENKQPHVVSYDLIRRLKPKNDDDKREVIMYARELEPQLRSLKMNNETDVMFEVCAEMGLYPSKYQRANMQVDGLTASPVWEVEKTGQAEHLENIQDNWVVIRRELKNLTQELEDWEWHENRELESKGLWGQFFYLGNGKTSLDLEGNHCKITPTFCNAMAAFTSALDCALCEVKLDYIDAGAHIAPHCGTTNAKLRANIPVTLGGTTHKTALGQPSFRQRVADQILEWREDKFTIWDDSFENELENESGTAQVLLTIDFKHPDIEPEDDFLDPRLWEVTVGEGGRANYQLRPDLMS